MRVVEPQKFTQQNQHIEQNKPARQRSRRARPLALVLLVAIISVAMLRSNSVDAPAVQQDPVANDQLVTPTPDTPPASTGELRLFSGNEFRIFYDNLLQPNLDRVDTPPSITGNEVADARIRQIAETRGYRLRSSPLTALPSVQGYRLQEVVHQPWLDLQAAAAAAGHQMSLVSAYRSVDTQRGLFTSRLAAQGVSVSDVENGLADAEVDAVLVTSSIPGYSKHHTGYTIDIQCAGFAFENFKNSPCNDWITANNYEQAKLHGFIPSYPPDADLQGPDPEAWEYVYVGSDLLKN